MDNTTKLKSLMWEYNVLDLYVEKHWPYTYEKLKSHNAEGLDYWCGVILKDIKDTFPKNIQTE